MPGTLPLIIVEEHHEAFYAWNYAGRLGWLDTAEATLLHVDEHADMALPRLRRPLSSIAGLGDLADFVYRELSINDFVWPAVYQGHFRRLFWMRARHTPSAGGWRQISIFPEDRRALTFSLRTQSSLDLQKGRTVEYAPLTTDSAFRSDGALVLDIDLDFFAWNSYPDLPECRIEVTEDTFREFRDNPYHWLRISPGAKISALIEDERFYLRYDDGPRVSAGGSEREDVTGRLESFFAFLRANEVRPELVTLCRSLHSGYTDRAHSPYIEAALMQGLEELYQDVSLYSITDLLVSSNHEQPEVYHVCAN